MQKIARETFPKSIQINTRAAPDLWPVFADATQLHQVLLNLCVNARDAMPDGGEILLSAENHTLDEVAAKRFMDAKAGPYLILAVSDTGAGIPPEIMDRIFEPFFTTKEVGQGTGLGLSTVVSIVKAHGGFLDVQSRLGEGTTFKIYLPAVESTTPLAGVEARRETRRGRGELILVVDDEPAIREMIGAVLADGGYRVAFACHGAEALTLCSQQSDAIALALVDLMMPVLDGPRTIGALRRLKPHLPIIALSGQPQTEETLEQMRSQEVTFLAKPFSREKLFDVLDGRLADPVHRQCPDASEVAE
jgi:CheY-like chemotaxis protein